MAHILRLLQKHWLLCLILVVASFLRLWNIPQTVQFLGDQGRDAMIVADIFRKLDPVFIGPVTSVGNMYLGPLYYYFMMPFLFLSYPSPLGPVYAVAVLSIVTVALMYTLGRQMFSHSTALLAALLFAVCATIVAGSRFSWNPNLAPLVSLLMIFSTYKAVTSRAKYWTVVIGLFAVLIQLHYLTLLSAGGFGVVWLYQVISLWREGKKKEITKIIWATAIGVCIFLVSLTPLVLFDIKHGGINQKAFVQIFTKEEVFEGQSESILERVGELVIDTHGRSMHILFDITLGQRRLLNTILVVIVLSVLAYLLAKPEKKEQKMGILVIYSFLLTGILGTSAYQHSLFDHYIAYLFPVAIYSIAITCTFLYKHTFGKIGAIAFLLVFAAHNWSQNQFILRPIGWQVRDIERTAQTIADRVKPEEKYNIILLSGTGDIDGQNYRYFLTTTENPPVPTEQRGEVKTLFIINEDKVLENVASSPIYEIVVFPDKEPAEIYEVPDGPTITVLRKKQE